MAGLLASLLLAAWMPSASSAKVGGYMEGWFVRSEADSATLLQKASAGGATIARVNVQWCELEPQLNNWDESKWTTAINRMTDIGDAGMRPLPILINAPSWARETNTGGSACAATGNDKAYRPSDANIPQWKQFVSTFIACMKNISCPPNVAKPGRDLELRSPPIQGYEIWNEPNLNKYWSGQDDVIFRGDADDYARMLGDSFDAANSRGATRPVVIGGLSFPNTGAFNDENVSAVNYLREIYSYFDGQGQQPKFDAIGVHPYGSHLHTTAQGASGRVADIMDVRDNHQDNAWIYVTEVGDDSCVPDPFPNGICTSNGTVQCRNLVDIWRTLNVPVIVFHRLLDQTTANEPERMGVTKLDPLLSPKRAYSALAKEWGEAGSACP